MIPRFKPTLPQWRLAVPSILLALACLGPLRPATVAAETNSIHCPVAARAGATPAPPEAAAAQPGSGQADVAAQGFAGMRAYVDPETGELTIPPSDARAAEAAAAAFSTSHEGLVEIPSPVPGGGVLVDLKGRFRSPLTATVGTDGKARMQHGPCMRASEEGK